MKLFKKLFGYRWSVYIVLGENNLIYAMHQNSVMRMLGYFMGYFKNGNLPIEPWNIYLNFNHDHKSIKLRTDHFLPNGDDINNTLIKEIESIDPKWQVKGDEPVFEEVSTRNKIPFRSKHMKNLDIQAMIDNAGKPKEITFYDIMDTIFEAH